VHLRHLAVPLFLLVASCSGQPAPPAAGAPGTAPAAARATPSAHPLEPPTADEITTAVQLARSDARLASAMVTTAVLVEPAKAEVLAWQPGRAQPRQARVQAMTPAMVYEAAVDLGRGAWCRWRSAPAPARRSPYYGLPAHGPAADSRRLLRHPPLDHQRLRLADRAPLRPRRSQAARGDRWHRSGRRADFFDRSPAIDLRRDPAAR
jgi:hypothetical protein